MSLKKSFFLVLTFLVACSMVVFAADAAKPKAPNSHAVKVQADKQVTSLMQQYKVQRAKTEKMMSTFRNIHDTQSTRGGAPEGLREDHCIVIVRPTLGVLKDFLRRQDDKGHGDMDYWIRTFNINRMQGFAARDELNRVLGDCGEDLSPLLRAAIKNVSSNLDRAMNKYDKGYGDLDYWVEVSGFVRDAISQAAANLDEIIGALPNVANSDPMAIIRAHAKVVANLMSAQRQKGYGSLDYWTRSYSLFNRQCAWGAESLRVLLNFVGDKVMPLLRNSIQNVINNLESTARKYEGGYGDMDYWVTACGFVCDGMHRAASDINQILNSI